MGRNFAVKQTVAARGGTTGIGNLVSRVLFFKCHLGLTPAIRIWIIKFSRLFTRWVSDQISPKWGGGHCTPGEGYVRTQCLNSSAGSEVRSDSGTKSRGVSGTCGEEGQVHGWHDSKVEIDINIIVPE